MASEDFTSNLSGIYVLKCPITKHIKYIGQTNNFVKRKYSHFCNNGKSLRLMIWFNSLEKINLKPIFEIYLICDDQKIKDKIEKKLIIKFNKTILNVRQGGVHNGIFIKKYKKRSEFI